MIKVLNYSSKNYSKELNVILQKRRSGKQLVNKKVKSILNDIKKNGIKAVFKYEKNFQKIMKLNLVKRKLDFVLNH